MKFLSVCSGIEAASVAWNPLGWESVGFSEIELFPCQVLKHHYPHVPNLGDMTKFKEWNLGPIDLFCGGTPCQSFSVAGLRKGLDDPRGNLMLTYLAIADKFRPRWLVWENVPGVLSSNGGRDFGSFLGGLGQLGYGFAYRVLDAQYFGVAQRRRRVFVVGYLGDWRPAAAVLFERDSLCGNPAPSREKRQETSRVAGTLTANCVGLNRPAGNANELDFCIPTTYDMKQHHSPQPSDTVQITTQNCCMVRGDTPLIQGCDTYNGVMTGNVAATLSTKSGDGVSSGPSVLQPMPINTMIATRHEALGEGTGFGIGESGDPAYTLTKGHSHAVAQPVSYSMITANTGSNGLGVTEELAPTLDLSQPAAIAQPIGIDEECNARVDGFGSLLRGGQGGTRQAVMQTNMAVRRLTPVECERLQGFPDHYTNIKPKGKPTPDGPRYKALGNSWAVPVARWIGERIMMVEAMK